MENTEKGKTVMWGDSPQDKVDDFLQKKGLKIKDLHKNKYSQKQIDAFHSKALKNKTLKKQVDKEFDRDWNRKAKQSEFKYHICFGLAGKPKGCRIRKKK